MNFSTVNVYKTKTMRNNADKYSSCGNFYESKQFMDYCIEYCRNVILQPNPHISQYSQKHI